MNNLIRNLTIRGGSQDLADGQWVIVTARWILVASALMLALIAPASLGELRVQLLLVLALAVFNFGLHAQLLRKRPAIVAVAYLASAADLAVITGIVVSQGGFRSDLYVFYFPAVIAFAIAFEPLVTYLYTAALVVIYASIATLTAPSGSGPEDLLTRCGMLAAVAVCAQLYWRVEAARRTGFSVTSDPGVPLPIPTSPAAVSAAEPLRGATQS